MRTFVSDNKKDGDSAAEGKLSALSDNRTLLNCMLIYIVNSKHGIIISVCLATNARSLCVEAYMKVAVLQQGALLLMMMIMIEQCCKLAMSCCGNPMLCVL